MAIYDWSPCSEQKWDQQIIIIWNFLQIFNMPILDPEKIPLIAGVLLTFSSKFQKPSYLGGVLIYPGGFIRRPLVHKEFLPHLDILAHQNLVKNKFFRTCRTHVHHYDARKLSHDVSWTSWSQSYFCDNSSHQRRAHCDTGFFHSVKKINHKLMWLKNNRKKSITWGFWNFLDWFYRTFSLWLIFLWLI